MIDNTHYTAWLTTTRGELEGDDCDITVVADGAVTFRDEDETEPVWSSTGDPLFYSRTGIPTDGDSDKIEKRAEELLNDAGWRTVGRWYGIPTGGIITVEPAC